MADTTLDRRVLGRTLLVRQHLVERTDASVVDKATHLVGLQAQEPRDPYLGLWSRLERFEPADLEQRLLDRAVVRIVLMRGTIHLVTADDAFALRPHVLPVLEKELERHSQYAPLLRDLDLGPVVEHARAFLAEPRSTKELRAELAERFPDLDPAALAYACRNHLALVQVPPRGLWTKGGQVTYATAEAWLPARPPAALTLDEAVVRYLRAFGPSTAADIAAWSRLTGLRTVVERLRPGLRTYRDGQGRELLDVADGAIAGADVEAPVRFLPEYDNALLSHADRSRIIDRSLLAGLYSDGHAGNGSVLVDGIVQATWRCDPRRHPQVVITHQPKLGRRDRAAVEAEADRARTYLTRGIDDAEIVLRPAENAGGPE